MSVHSKYSPLILRLLTLTRHSQVGQIPNQSEQGLSLIECLVAIIIIALTVVSVTPPVFLATASRIQARRAEQANQIAQSEVDRVRAIVERQASTINNLPATVGATINTTEGFVPATSIASLILSPSASCGTRYPQATPVANTTLVPVDVDGDCEAEFAMQVFRTDGCPAGAGANPPDSFMMGVRVYAYVPGEALPTYTTERATLGLTLGRRDQDSGTSRKPLQVLYSKVARSNDAESIECVAN